MISISLFVAAYTLGSPSPVILASIESQDPVHLAANEYWACIDQASERFMFASDVAEEVVEMAASACLREGSRLLQASQWLDHDSSLLTGEKRAQHLLQRRAEIEAIKTSIHQVQAGRINFKRSIQEGGDEANFLAESTL